MGREQEAEPSSIPMNTNLRSPHSSAATRSPVTLLSKNTPSFLHVQYLLVRKCSYLLAFTFTYSRLSQAHRISHTRSHTQPRTRASSKDRSSKNTPTNYLNTRNRHQCQHRHSLLPFPGPEHCSIRLPITPAPETDTNANTGSPSHLS
jgi:hypothetical protein